MSAETTKHASTVTDTQLRARLLTLVDQHFEIPLSTIDEYLQFVPGAGDEVKTRILERQEQLKAVITAAFDTTTQPGTPDTTPTAPHNNRTYAAVAESRADSPLIQRPSITKVHPKHASLVQVLFGFSDEHNICVPARVSDTLRTIDPRFFTRSVYTRFKDLVLEAQREGAPIQWIYEDGTAIKVTLDDASRRHFIENMNGRFLQVNDAPDDNTKGVNGRCGASHFTLAGQDMSRNQSANGGPEHLSLLYVLLKHCNSSGFIVASHAATELRSYDAGYYERSMHGKFKDMVIAAQKDGLPAKWIPETEQPAMVRLTISHTAREQLRALHCRKVVVAPTSPSSTAISSKERNQSAIVSVPAEYSSLVQVLLELCSVKGTCLPSRAADALRARDPGFFSRWGTRSFKDLVLQAQVNGAPLMWGWSENQAAEVIKLTLSVTLRQKFQKLRAENSELMLSSSTLFPVMGSTTMFHQGQGYCLPPGAWATPSPHVPIAAPPSATSCSSTFHDDDIH